MLIRITEISDDKPIRKVGIKKTNTKAIGFNFEKVLFFSWKNRRPAAKKEIIAETENSGESITSLKLKDSFFNSIQNQSKLNIKSNKIVPNEPSIL